MADLWGAEGRPVAYNLEVYGVPNAAQQARIDGGEVMNSYWTGEMQTRAYGPTDPVKLAQQLKAVLPWANIVRHPFNQHSFDDAGNFLDYNEAFFVECKAQGIKILFPLMDGPSWQSPTITSASVGDWLTHMAGVHAGQMAGHNKLIAWMQAHAATRPEVWGVEAINEPNMYHIMESQTHDQAQAVKLYIDHCIDIWGLWHAAFPTMNFGVQGWLYAFSLRVLDSYLPTYHMSGTDALRAAVGANLFWSMHHSPTPDYTIVPPLMGTALGIDRIMNTESHCRGNHADEAPPAAADDTVSNYLYAMNGDMWARYSFGMGWWTGANYARARLVQIAGDGTDPHVLILFWACICAWLHVSSYGQHPRFFTGPEMGAKTPIVKTVAQLYNPGDAYPPSPFSSFATAFGGRGVCVIQALTGTNNSLHGGDGWNVLYGAVGSGDDHLYLGRGGGIVRTTQGMNRILGPSHNTARIWTGTGKDVVSLRGKSATTIVVNPSQAQCWIWDFNPQRVDASNGDRISFNGIFPDAATLRAACSVVLAERYQSNAGLIDLRIDLPNGGYVVLQNGAGLLETLGQYCLDITDGWYRSGWAEPADYDPALLTVDPGPNLTDWYADATSGTVGDGGPVPIYNRTGQQVLAQNRAGTIVQVS